MSSALPQLPPARAGSGQRNVLHVVIDPGQVHSDLHLELAPTSPRFAGNGHAGISADAPPVWPPRSYVRAVARVLEDAVNAQAAALAALGVAQVAFLCVNSRADMFRLGFEQSHDKDRSAFAEAEKLSFVEPPTAAVLELQGLPYAALYVPSHAHQLHSFIVQVWASRAPPRSLSL